MRGVGVAVGFGVGVAADLNSALPLVAAQFGYITTGKLFPLSRGSW